MVSRVRRTRLAPPACLLALVVVVSVWPSQITCSDDPPPYLKGGLENPGYQAFPELPYPYDALGDVIDPTTLKVHHAGHHKAYVNKYNAVLQDISDTGYDHLLTYTPAQIVNKQRLAHLPPDIARRIAQNGGGLLNHALFWNIMDSVGGDDRSPVPGSAIANAIQKTYGDFETFKAKFTEAANSVFGSGWVFLHEDAETLQITAGANQETPLNHGHIPILALDLWEHAYYLKYKNKRGVWIKNWWKAVSWDKVNRLLLWSRGDPSHLNVKDDL